MSDPPGPSYPCFGWFCFGFFFFWFPPASRRCLGAPLSTCLPSRSSQPRWPPNANRTWLVILDCVWEAIEINPLQIYPPRYGVVLLLNENIKRVCMYYDGFQKRKPLTCHVAKIFSACLLETEWPRLVGAGQIWLV